MSSPPDLGSLRGDPAVGEACVRRVRHLLRRVAGAPTDEEAHARHAAVKQDFEVLRPALTLYDAFLLKERRTSGTLAHLERQLAWLAPPIPWDDDEDEEDEQDAAAFLLEVDTPAPPVSPPPDPQEIELQALTGAVRAPPEPLLGLPEGPLDVRVLHVIEARSSEQAVVVRLDGPRASARLLLWDPWWIEGSTTLRGARLEVSRGSPSAPFALRFVSPGGTLEIGGEPTLEIEERRDSNVPPPGAIDVPGWIALVDVLNERSRWDYDIDPWDGPDDRPSLALRGTSGAYEKGCALRLSGVSRARLVRFSHPVFRVDGVTDEGVTLAIRASFHHVHGPGELFVVARGAELVDDPPFVMSALEREGPAPAIEVESVPPLAVALSADSGVQRLIAALFAREGDRGTGPESLALDAALRRVRGSPALTAIARSAGPVTPIDDAALAGGLIRLVERRAASTPEALLARLCSPLAPGPVRDAAVRGARGLLDDLLGMPFGSAQEYIRSRDERDSLPERAIPPRLREDATREAAITLARHALGLPGAAVSLDVTAITTGRVLVDPETEARLPEAERLARAVGLLVLQRLRDSTGGAAGPAILDLLPDPAARRRVADAAPLLDKLSHRIPELAEELLARTSLVEEELALFLAGEMPALRHYRLLSAVLLGHPALVAVR